MAAIPDRSGFILISCGIDILSGFFCGRKSKKDKGVGVQYKRFIKEYMSTYDPEEFYNDIRCALVHNFLLDNFALTHTHPELHFKLDKTGRTILNLEDFTEDFRRAAHSYFKDLNRGKFITEFKTRFDSMGGIIDKGLLVLETY